MIDRDRWTRLLFELHARNTEDTEDVTVAERETVLQFSDIHDQFENPEGAAQ